MEKEQNRVRVNMQRVAFNSPRCLFNSFCAVLLFTQLIDQHDTHTTFFILIRPANMKRDNFKFLFRKMTGKYFGLQKEDPSFNFPGADDKNIFQKKEKDLVVVVRRIFIFYSSRG